MNSCFRIIAEFQHGSLQKNNSSHSQFYNVQSQNMVKNLIKQLQNAGLKIIYANCEGFSNPDKLQGAQPDIIGWDSDKQLLHVGLVADSKKISSAPFKERFDVLTNLSMASGNSKGRHVPFYLGITKDVGDFNDEDFAGKMSSQDKIVKIGS